MREKVKNVENLKVGLYGESEYLERAGCLEGGYLGRGYEEKYKDRCGWRGNM